MVIVEDSHEPLPVTTYGGIQVYIVPFLVDKAATTRLLKKTDKALVAAEKDKYFV